MTLNTPLADAPNAARPLSPADFQPTAGSGAGEAQAPLKLLPEASAADGWLDDSARLTLQAALNRIRDARVIVRSADTVAANDAKLEIAQIISYLTGFLDAHGFGQTAPATSGFQSILGKLDQLSIERSLDQLELALEQLINSPPTRGWRNRVAAVLDSFSAADTAIGVGLSIATPVAFFAPTP